MQKRKIMSESRIQQPGQASQSKPKTVQVKSISGMGKVNVGKTPPAAAAAKPAAPAKPVVRSAAAAPVAAASQEKAPAAKFNAADFARAAKAKILPVLKTTLDKHNKARAEKAAKAAQSPKAKPVKKTEPFRPGTRVLALAGGTLTVAIVLLLVMQFAGGDADTPVAAAKPATVVPSAQPAPVVAAAPVVQAPVSEPFAAQADTTPAVQSSSDVMVGNIIDALRQTANSAPAADAAEATAPQADSLNSVSNLAKIVVTAMEQGQSEAYIQGLLNDAQAKGEIVVPAPLLRADGTVDTATILTLFAKN